MNVICLEDAALYVLIDQVVSRLKEKDGKTADKWVTPDEAMRLLNVKKTTLQNYRDQGKIRFTGERKTLLYDRDSIMEYHEKNAQNKF